jgi:hypothetical protein
VLRELDRKLGCGQQPGSASSRHLGKGNRPAQSGNRDGRRASSPGTQGGGLELSGDRLVGSDGGGRGMPHGTVGLIDKRLGERGVRDLPLREARHLGYGGTNQGMSEVDPALVDVNQLGRLRRLQVRQRRRSPDQPCVASSSSPSEPPSVSAAIRSIARVTDGSSSTRAARALHALAAHPW